MARGMAKRETPPGMSWCAGHQDFLPVDMFSRHRRDGYQRHCKDCHRKYVKEWAIVVRSEREADRVGRRQNKHRGIVIRPEPRISDLATLAAKYANR